MAEPATQGLVRSSTKRMQLSEASVAPSRPTLQRSGTRQFELADGHSIKRKMSRGNTIGLSEKSGGSIRRATLPPNARKPSLHPNGQPELARAGTRKVSVAAGTLRRTSTRNSVVRFGPDDDDDDGQSSKFEASRKAPDKPDKVAVEDESQSQYLEHTVSDFWLDLLNHGTWASRSLGIWPKDHPLRKLAISFTHTHEWKTLVQLFIIANCINMMLYDPLQPTSARNMLLEQFELMFTIIFTIELVVQVIASGLIIPGPTAYTPVAVYFRGLRDVLLFLRCRMPSDMYVIAEPAYLLVGWNRLDAVVVAASWIAIAVNAESVTVLRLLRLLKPLRTLRAMPGLRLLISVCGRAIVQQLTVLLLANGLICYFIAPLLPLWAGSMTGRCVDETAWDLEDEARRVALSGANETFERLCALPARNVEDGRMCEPGFVCVDSGLNPVFGLRSFDNAGSAWLIMQQFATMDRWSFAMYQLQDANGVHAFLPAVGVVLTLAYGVLLLSLLVTVVKVSQELQDLDMREADEMDGGGSFSGRESTREVELFGKELFPQLKLDGPNKFANGTSFVQGKKPYTHPLTTAERERRILCFHADQVAELLEGGELPAIAHDDRHSSKVYEGPVVCLAMAWSGTARKWYSPLPPNADEEDQVDALLDVYERRKPEFDDYLERMSGRGRLAASHQHGRRRNVLVRVREGVHEVLEALAEARESYPLKTSAAEGSLRWRLFRFISMPRRTYDDVFKAAQLEARASQRRTTAAGRFPSWRQVLADEAVRMSWFEQFIMLMIVMSAVLLGCYAHEMPVAEELLLDHINMGLTIVFVFEVAIKVVAYGPLIWSCSPVNWFDLLLMLASLPEIFVAGGAISLNFMRLLRLVRLVRSLKAIYKIKSVRRLLAALRAGSKEIWSYTLLLSLYLFIITLAGMQLYGGKSSEVAKPRSGANFDNLGAAAISALQIMLGSDWFSIAVSLLDVNGLTPLAFIMPVLFLGKYFLIQLLTAIFISRLPAKNYIDAEQESRHERKVERARMHKKLKKLTAVANGTAEYMDDITTEKSVTDLSRDGSKADGGRSLAPAEYDSDEEDSLPHADEPRLARYAGQVVNYKSRRFPLLSFENLVLLLIFLSMVMLSLETRTDWPASFTHLLDTGDYVLTSFFCVEIVLQMVYQRLRWTHSGWNWLDFVIVLSALVSYLPFSQPSDALTGINATMEAAGGGNQLAAAKGIRALRVLRPLRAIKRFPRLRSTVSTLLASIPATFGVLLMAIFIWYIMACLGVQFLGGKLSVCADSWIPLAACPPDRIEPSVLNFNTLGSSMLTLLSLFKLDNWPIELARATEQASLFTTIFVSAYFVAFVFFGSIFVTSLYMAILVNQHKESHHDFLTEAQKMWFKAQKVKALLEQERKKTFFVRYNRRSWLRKQLHGSALADLWDTVFPQRLFDPKVTKEIPRPVKAAFKKFDKGSGYLNFMEFRSALEHYGIRVTAADLQALRGRYNAHQRQQQRNHAMMEMSRRRKRKDERPFGDIKEFNQMVVDIMTALPQSRWEQWMLRLQYAYADRAIKPDNRIGRARQVGWVRNLAWNVVQGNPPHQLFETSFCVIVLINWLLALSRHEGQSDRLDDLQFTFCVVVCVFGVAETAMKLAAYETIGFISSWVDLLDGAMSTWLLVSMIYVLESDSWSSMMADLAEGHQFDRTDLFLAYLPSLLMAYRLPRLLYQWRFFRPALVHLRLLLRTLMMALPAMANVLLLLLLVIYIYAILGVFWFASITGDTEEGINDRANFENLGTATLTLFRVFTGDTWTALMLDCMRDSNGGKSAGQMVMSVAYFGSFTITTYFGSTLLVAVTLLEGLGAYFDTGVVADKGLWLTILKVKARFMRPVHRLRKRKKAGNLWRVMQQEKQSSAGMLECLKEVDLMFEALLPPEDCDESFMRPGERDSIDEAEQEAMDERIESVMRNVENAMETGSFCTRPKAAGAAPSDCKARSSLAAAGAVPRAAPAPATPVILAGGVVAQTDAAEKKASLCVPGSGSSSNRASAGLPGRQTTKVRRNTTWRLGSPARKRLNSVESLNASEEDIEPVNADGVPGLFLQACWEASELAHVQTGLHPSARGAAHDPIGISYQDKERTEREVRIKRVRRLLKYLPRPSTVAATWTLSGDTALHVAAFRSDVQLTKLLLEHTADPNHANKGGKAANVSDAAGLSACASDQAHLSALEAASRAANGPRSALTKLLQDGLLHSNTPVHYCILMDRSAAVARDTSETRESMVDRQRRTFEQLIWPQAFIQDANVRSGDPGKANAEGFTPLHIAIQRHAHSIISLLLSWDYDLHHTIGNTREFRPSRQSVSKPTRASVISPSTAFVDEADDAERNRHVPSLCNLYNPLTGDTPLLLCLRRCDELLRRDARDEAYCLHMLELFRELVRHPETDVFSCRLTHNQQGRFIHGGRASPLLLLLAVSEKLHAAVPKTADQKYTTERASEIADELSLELVARADTEEKREKLCVCLFELHGAGVWRGFRNRDMSISCLALALSLDNNKLIASDSVQEAISRAWMRSSRYHFWVSLILYTLLILSTTAVGWLSIGSIGFHRSFQQQALQLHDEERSMMRTTSLDEWVGWLVDTFVPAVAPPWARGDPNATSDDGHWYLADALRILKSGEASVSLPFTDVSTVQAELRRLAANWTEDLDSSVVVIANILSPYEKVVAYSKTAIAFGPFGEIDHSAHFQVLPPWHIHPGLALLQALAAVGMLVSCGVEGIDIRENGWHNHLKSFWNVVDLLHHMLFLFVLLLVAIEKLLSFDPSEFEPSQHMDIDFFAGLRSLYMQVLSLFILVGWLRLAKYLRMMRHVGVLVEVIRVMLSQLWAFLCLFLMLWIATASAMVPLYGEKSVAFAKFDRAFLETFHTLVMSQQQEFWEDDEGFLHIVYELFMGIMVALLMVNLLIAILNQSYTYTIDAASQRWLMLQAKLTLDFYVRLGGGRRVIRTEDSQAPEEGTVQGMLEGHEAEQLVPPTAMSDKPRSSALLVAYDGTKTQELHQLQSHYLWRMNHPAFGDALSKLQFFRQVFFQCVKDEASRQKNQEHDNKPKSDSAWREAAERSSKAWLKKHAVTMITPHLESVVQQLSIRFPHVDSATILALLQGPCEASGWKAADVLSGKTKLSMSDEIRLVRAREHLKKRAELGVEHVFKGNNEPAATAQRTSGQLAGRASIEPPVTAPSRIDGSPSSAPAAPPADARAASPLHSMSFGVMHALEA